MRTGEGTLTCSCQCARRQAWGLPSLTAARSAAHRHPAPSSPPSQQSERTYFDNTRQRCALRACMPCSTHSAGADGSPFQATTAPRTFASRSRGGASSPHLATGRPTVARASVVASSTGLSAAEGVAPRSHDDGRKGPPVLPGAEWTSLGVWFCVHDVLAIDPR